MRVYLPVWTWPSSPRLKIGDKGDFRLWSNCDLFQRGKVFMSAKSRAVARQALLGGGGGGGVVDNTFT